MRNQYLPESMQRAVFGNLEYWIIIYENTKWTFGNTGSIYSKRKEISIECLDLWNFETLERWNFETFERWNCETKKPRNHFLFSMKGIPLLLSTPTPTPAPAPFLGTRGNLGGTSGRQQNLGHVVKQLICYKICYEEFASLVVEFRNRFSCRF